MSSCSVVTPTSFVYGNSIDASRFVQLEDMECNFQPLNLTFQVLIAPPVLFIVSSMCVCTYLSVDSSNLLSVSLSLSLSLSLSCLCVIFFQAINNGPSRLPGSTVDIRLPNRLAGSGADMFHIIDTQVGARPVHVHPPCPLTIQPNGVIYWLVHLQAVHILLFIF